MYYPPARPPDFTPNELFYTRNHAAVPEIEPEEYELIVELPDMPPKKFTLEDLKTKFKQYDVVTTIQCAGNRGEDYHGIGKGKTRESARSRGLCGHQAH